jgi:hypothetical protein
LEIEKGAPAPGAVFRALAENRESFETIQVEKFYDVARSAGRGAGVIPQLREFEIISMLPVSNEG